MRIFTDETPKKVVREVKHLLRTGWECRKRVPHARKSRVCLQAAKGPWKGPDVRTLLGTAGLLPPKPTEQLLGFGIWSTSLVRFTMFYSLPLMRIGIQQAQQAHALAVPIAGGFQRMKPKTSRHHWIDWSRRSRRTSSNPTRKPWFLGLESCCVMLIWFCLFKLLGLWKTPFCWYMLAFENLVWWRRLVSYAQFICRAWFACLWKVFEIGLGPGSFPEGSWRWRSGVWDAAVKPKQSRQWSLLTCKALYKALLFSGTCISYWAYLHQRNRLAFRFEFESYCLIFFGLAASDVRCLGHWHSNPASIHIQIDPLRPGSLMRKSLPHWAPHWIGSSNLAQYRARCGQLGQDDLCQRKGMHI